MIGTLRNTVLDCPDPRALAAFYRAVLGWEVTEDSSDWVSLAPSTGHPGLAFQEAPDLRAPDWPGSERPQQLHLDIHIGSRAELESAEAAVLALGARPLQGDLEGHTFRVYADPAGHPFCLVWP